VAAVVYPTSVTRVVVKYAAILLMDPLVARTTAEITSVVLRGVHVAAMGVVRGRLRAVAVRVVGDSECFGL
jgi:hypothetical protein